MNLVNEIKKKNISNIFEYANDEKFPEKWEERKNKWLEDINDLFKLRDFVTKHLKQNFVRLIPNADCFEEIQYQDRFLGLRLENDFQDPNFKFTLHFHFGDRKELENEFKFEVKVKDIATKCKVINKKELKNIFQKVLFRIGYEAGYTQCLIARYETEIKIFRDEKEKLIIKENIIDDLPLKVQYEATLQRVRNDVKKNIELHKFEDYLKRRFHLRSDPVYISFLRKEIGFKKITISALTKSLERYRLGLKNT